MGIKNRITEAAPVKIHETLEEKLYREEREFRADRLVEKWSRIPEVGKGIERMPSTVARNLGILLENQARAMSKLSEAQLSGMFQGQSPENMLRLIRLTYPNSIRGRLFTEFSCETTKDSIKYIKSEYTASQTGKPLDNRFDRAFSAEDYASNVMYESSESRYATELVNVSMIGAGANFTAANAVSVTFADPAGLAGDYYYGVFGQNGESYIDGSSVFYVVVNGERKPLAIQDGRGVWFYGNEVAADPNGTEVVYLKVVAATKSAVASGDNEGAYNVVFSIQGKKGEDGAWHDVTDAAAYEYAAIGRYNSERDLIGENLGEVEITPSTYVFEPRPVLLGVTWTTMTELVLDTSYGVSAEETLLDYAAQEIKKSLDFNAVKFAAAQQAIRAKDNFLNFDAASGDQTDDSYKLTAQLITNAINRIGDLQLNKIQRGGVSAIVGGPAAINYLTLHDQFTTRGAQPAIGGHQVGELAGIPIFKVPSNVYPDADLLTTWKNDTVEADVSIAIGTLLPFWTSGTIQRKNLYKEAAIARFEDTVCLNPLYLGRIRISNMRYM